jgi:UDP-N-acetylglucosamine--N-acetylmuramyl-(pentapeptide) pyrophosphoryl-undecaprenol N-acetylglucosamine transferase
MSENQVRLIVFAGGGTAGHVEPALAVANKWKELFPLDEEIFVGTAHGLENVLVPAAGFALTTIPKVVLPRKPNLGLLALPWRFARAVWEARKVVSGVDLVIGFGGYVCAPTYIAARLEKVPIVIHEANAKVGWANRLGSFFSHNLATSHRIPFGSFASARVTGLPLRATILMAANDAAADWQMSRSAAKRELGWTIDQPTLLILGGSQGSAFINGEIAKSLFALTRRGVQILHSVGAKNQLPTNSQNYVAVPYIEEMATAYLAADIVIARSGAVTCAEFGALGRFAVFVPLAVGNGEQARNADYLVAAGKAVVISQKQFSATWLVDNFDDLQSRSHTTSAIGLVDDLHAVDEIVALMKDSLKSGKA